LVTTRDPAQPPIIADRGEDLGEIAHDVLPTAKTYNEASL
jgi:hypothetical protein